MDEFDFEIMTVITELKKLPNTLPALIIMEMTSRDLATLEEARNDEEYQCIGAAIVRRIEYEIRMRERAADG
jgi:hypothetical protein